MGYLINKLQESGLVENFLKSPERNGPLSKVYFLQNQYRTFKEGLEVIFRENPEILPEFPLVFGMVKRELFPTISLKEYHSLTDQGIIDEFRRQKEGDPRKGITQGYILTGTAEKYLQEELIDYLETVRKGYSSKRKAFGEGYGPENSLWEAVSIADRLKPAILGSVSESFTNRAKDLNMTRECGQ